MNPAQAAARGQGAARRLMTDTCQITDTDYDHPTGVDAGTGRDLYPQVTLYDGPCRVKPNPGMPRPAQVGDSPVMKLNYIVSVPLSVTGLRAGNLVRITSATDPQLADRMLRVRSIVAGTQVTARRLDCEEASG